MAWANACGGRRWQMRADGLIDVEGIGAPVFDPGTPQMAQLASTWASWRRPIVAAARRYGAPPAWIVAIMTEETGLWSHSPSEQAAKVSPAGAIGLMQIMPDTARLFGADPSAMVDPASNIDVGTALIARLSSLRSGQLPEIAAAYNSGSACAPGLNQWNLRMADDYAGNVIRWNNSAVSFLDLSAGGSAVAAILLGGAGIYAAAIILGELAPPRFARGWM